MSIAYTKNLLYFLDHSLRLIQKGYNCRKISYQDFHISELTSCASNYLALFPCSIMLCRVDALEISKNLKTSQSPKKNVSLSITANQRNRQFEPISQAQNPAPASVLLIFPLLKLNIPIEIDSILFIIEDYFLTHLTHFDLKCIC